MDEMANCLPFLSKKIIILHYIFTKVLLLNVGNKKYKLFLKNVF